MNSPCFLITFFALFFIEWNNNLSWYNCHSNRKNLSFYLNLQHFSWQLCKICNVGYFKFMTSEVRLNIFQILIIWVSKIITFGENFWLLVRTRGHDPSGPSLMSATRSSPCQHPETTSVLVKIMSLIIWWTIDFFRGFTSDLCTTSWFVHTWWISSYLCFRATCIQWLTLHRNHRCYWNTCKTDDNSYILAADLMTWVSTAVL